MAVSHHGHSFRDYSHKSNEKEHHGYDGEERPKASAHILQSWQTFSLPFNTKYKEPPSKNDFYVETTYESPTRSLVVDKLTKGKASFNDERHVRQQHVSPSTPGKCWKQKTTKKGKPGNLDGLLLLLLQPTADQITKEKSKYTKIRQRNCWPNRPKQSPVFSIRCSCCLRSKYMRELLHNDCADIPDPQSYAETWLSCIYLRSHPLMGQQKKAAK